MATRRLKITGFARFFVVMLFLVPLAYIGASYYNGQDGIQNIKNLFGIDTNKPRTERVETLDNQSVQNTPTIITDRSSSNDSRRIDQLEKRMNALENENAQLRNQVSQQDLELKDLRRQLRTN